MNLPGLPGLEKVKADNGWGLGHNIWTRRTAARAAVLVGLRQSGIKESQSFEIFSPIAHIIMMKYLVRTNWEAYKKKHVYFDIYIKKVIFPHKRNFALAVSTKEEEEVKAKKRERKNRNTFFRQKVTEMFALISFF